MKNNLTFKELQSICQIRLAQYPTKTEFDSVHWAVALAGEVGELCNFVKKEFRDGKDLSKEIAKEIADIQIYLALLANHRGLDLDAVTVDKFNEVSDRIGSDVKL